MFGNVHSIQSSGEEEGGSVEEDEQNKEKIALVSDMRLVLLYVSKCGRQQKACQSVSF